MAKVRRTEITLDSERVFIFSRAYSFKGWCEQCGRVTRMIPTQEAVKATGLTIRGLCRLIEGGKLHFVESEDGSLLFICTDSLAVYSAKSD